MALKLDMSKAYDKVEWPFLEVLIRKIGFADRWIDVTMRCVTTVTYSIIVNGESKGLFILEEALDKEIPYPHSFSFYA